LQNTADSPIILIEHTKPVLLALCNTTRCVAGDRQHNGEEENRVPHAGFAGNVADAGVGLASVAWGCLQACKLAWGCLQACKQVAMIQHGRMYPAKKIVPV
jgi:hypothetical protein